MGTLTFVEHDESAHTVTIEPGRSLMQLATENAVPGIDADCGGDCACGTCHIILAPATFAELGAPDATELQMLDMTPEREPTSRLACQVTATEQLDGATVRLPEFQM